MDDFFYIAPLFLVFIVLPILIACLLYWIPKRNGYPLTGRVLCASFILILLVYGFMNLFEEQLFTKADAKELVEEQGFLLKGKFDLVENRLEGYNHFFTITISEQDKANAISKITKAENFNGADSNVTSRKPKPDDRYNGPTVISNYDTDSTYVRTYLHPNGSNYKPTFRRILIIKNRNEIRFEDIEQ